MRALSLLAIAISGLSAQTFEVVSLKPLDRGAHPGPPRRDPGMVSLPNATIKLLIMRAYDIAPYQVNGPAWMDSGAQAYSFSAKIPDGVAEDKVPQMMQAMLADRFALKAHWESRVEGVYQLTVGKNGSKLTPSEIKTAVKDQDGRVLSMLEISSTGRLIFRFTTMAQFARAISSQVGRPVIDRTGIVGTFDINVDSNPEELDTLRRMSATGEIPALESSSSSIFTGLQALGLKLEAKKEPVQHLVIESVLKEPTEN